MTSPNAPPLHERKQSRWRLSRAAKVTLFMAGLLAILTATAWIFYQTNPFTVAWGDYMTIGRATTLLALASLTLFLVYCTARVWFEELPARDNEVERAWLAGINALNVMGISLHERALYIYLGCTNRADQDRFIESSGEKLISASIPSGSAPLTWYISEKSIRLFCCDMGVLGKTIARLPKQTSCWDPRSWQQSAYTSRWAGTSSADSPREESEPTTDNNCRNNTTAPDNSAAVHDQRSQDPHVVLQSTRANSVSAGGGTMVMERAAPSEQLNANVSVERIDGNIARVERLISQELAATACASEVRIGQQSTARHFDSINVLTSTERVADQQKLVDFAMRLKAARRPVAAVNGIGIMVDITPALSSLSTAATCGQAIRHDLALLESILGVHAPVTLILNSAERVPGFGELIRRLGPEKAARGWVGAACDPSQVCDRELVEQLASRILGNLGLCTYQMLSGPGVLTIPGNERLIQLIMACRGSARDLLRCLLTEAFLTRTANADSRTGCAGVYLTANGSTSAQRGLVAQVLETMHSHQHLLSWTHDETRKQSYQRIALRFLIASALILLVTLVIQLL